MHAFQSIIASKHDICGILVDWENALHIVPIWSERSNFV